MSTRSQLALVGLTGAAVVGLGRLFTDASFLPPVLLVTALAHLLAWGTRRLGLGPLTAALLAGLGLMLTLGWVLEPHTLTVGLPLGSTWHALSDDLHDAWSRFSAVRAPTSPVRGFLVAGAIGGWLSAFTADGFAFRFGARFEALIPSFMLFVFGAVLGADRNRLATSGLYLAAALLFVVATDADRREASSWFAGRAADGHAALLKAGLATAVVGVVGALVAGPLLPGAHSRGLVGLRDDTDQGASNRVTISPLVDIRSRLVDQSGVELFTVRSPTGAYWRLTSLERFDGTIWSSEGTYQPAGGQLPTGVSTRAGEDAVAQQFSIEALNAIWLPAAYRPQRLDGARGVRFDPDSASLLTDAASASGLRYSVQSATPRMTAEDLAPVSPAVPAEVARRYEDLPAGFPEGVRRQARTVVAAGAATCARLGCSASESAGGALSPYHKALALQGFFRENFRYDLNVAPGHDESAIEHFLDVRRGYCEQFAGTFAAMARVVGLPSRVAVGFTPGDRAADGTFHVTGSQAHAWPEVYLAGFGWVAFEPTPGRAIPGGESYTGVAPVGATRAPGPAHQAPATAPPTTAAPSSPVTTAAAEPRQAPTSAAGSGGGLPAGPVIPMLVAAALLVAAVPGGRWLVRSRRRAAASTPTARVLLAWDEAAEALALAGARRRPSETATELARRAEALGGPPLGELARMRSSAAFSPTGADTTTAEEAEAAAAEVASRIRAGVGRGRRVGWALDPRPLLDPLVALRRSPRMGGGYSSRLKRLRRRLPVSPK